MVSNNSNTRHNNREARAAIARQTMDILKEGRYLSTANREVNTREELEYAMKNSVLITPDMERRLEEQLRQALAGTRPAPSPKTAVTEESTLKAARRLVEQEGYEKVACLNFASAKNPGGGFLNGSNAQEESLARAGGLYACISQHQAMYEANRSYRSALYTDHMIYSPRVPVFRDEADRLLEKPFYVSIITAPAVNAGVVKASEPKNVSRIQSSMETRIGRILALALLNGHDALVLGAYGCGVFKNDPHAVARSFAHHLGPGGRFAGVFPCVTFAIPGGTMQILTFTRSKSTFAAEKTTCQPAPRASNVSTFSAQEKDRGR